MSEKEQKQELEVREIVKPAVSADKALESFKAFQEIKEKLLKSEDKFEIAGKPYINKQGWRKIKTIFNLSQEIICSNREVDNGVVRWTFRVRVSAKNGAFADAEMCCSSDEPFAKNKPETSVMAMAQTRAFNRAISDLVGGGEISAEEVVSEEEIVSGDKLACDSCAKKVTQKVADYSAKEFGRILCYSCQKKVRDKAELQEVSV